jgi:uncharacterized protein
MKSLAKFFLALVFLGAISGSSYAFDAPVLKGRVNDYANLLTAPQREALENTLRTLEGRTSAQVVILTVTSMQGLDVDAFSLKVFEVWKLGQKGVDNGLLIVYSTDGDHYRVEVGYGLEGAIPDGVAGDILRHQLRAKADPKHGTRDFNGAFTDAVARISGIIAAEVAKDPTGASMRRVDHGKLFLVVIIAFIIVMICGFINPIFGGVVGAIGGAAVAMVAPVGTTGFIVMVIVGAVIGSVIRVLAESSGGGGSSGGFVSGSDSGSSFSGGGGGSGGGGASD